MPTERNIQFRAIHDKNPWRKASHDSITNALGTKRGAAALFQGKAAINYATHGDPRYVIIWSEHAQSGIVVKPDPDQLENLLQADISIDQIQRYEAAGAADPAELDALFGDSSPMGDNAHSDGPPDVDEYTMRAIMTRRGQATFREALLSAYNGKCAITGCDATEALEAAHITPFSEEQSYDIRNGILLRADIHTLFDLYLISVDPQSGKVLLADTLLRAYPELIDRCIVLPESESARPDLAGLLTHYRKWVLVNAT